MTRKHSHRGMMLGLERRKARLQVRADSMARRSARQLGVVLSLAKLVELRKAITRGSLPETVRYVGRTGTSLDAYTVDMTGVSLIALHDRRGQLIASFAGEGDLDIHQTK